MAAGGLGDGTTIVGERFDRERVVLGGRRFERCAFADCELVFDGRPVRLVDGSFERCRWTFEGAAAVTLDFVGVLCRRDQGLAAMIGGALGLLGEAARGACGASAAYGRGGSASRPRRSA